MVSSLSRAAVSLSLAFDEAARLLLQGSLADRERLDFVALFFQLGLKARHASCN